ncbi:acyltransferase [Ochrobactrum daejeonense]|nr:acyltransferase [Brucella daejeonensis]
MSYRYDIEGLRAVAVLLVVIFHINETLIPGGFIGVDLFFVISGYVITQRIYKDGLSTFADFTEFYRRRIRRIAPVMLFVTAITLAIGVFVLLPEDLVDLSWSAIFASFSAANIYFTFFWIRAISPRTATIFHCCTSGRLASKNSSIWFGRYCSLSS